MKLPAPVAIVVALALGANAWGQSETSPETIFNRASQSMQAGDYAQAEAGFNQVLAADPNNFAALGNLGVLYARTHRLAAAITVDEKALSIDPHDSAILLNLGLAYMKQEDYARARPYFERLDAANAGGARVTVLLATCLVLGDAPQQGLDLLLSRKPEDSSALYLEAVAYARLNQVETGKKIFAQLLSRVSTRAQTSFLLGEVLHDGHHLQEAADSLQETLQQDPAFPGGHRELGKVYVSMQRFDEAERELRLAVAQNSQDGSALYFLGALLVQTAKYADGISFLNKAKLQLPDSWAIPFYIGKAHVKLRQSEAAVQELKQAAALNGDEPSVLYLLATALRATGHPREAQQAMERVQELHSTALDAEKAAMRTKIAGSR